MSFIRTVHPAEAADEVRSMYQRQQARFGYVPNYARAFSWRPELMTLWSDLLSGVRQNIGRRRFEIVTLSAALALRNSYCALAHGRALTEMISDDDVQAIAAIALDAIGERPPLAVAVPENRIRLNALDRAIVRYAARAARSPETLEEADVDELRRHGLTEAEIFDLAATVAARAFFTRLLDALGVQPDPVYRGLAPALKRTLTVGRPIAGPVEASVEMSG
jgi:uncharacterized peroxidase-related enzyme